METTRHFCPQHVEEPPPAHPSDAGFRYQHLPAQPGSGPAIVGSAAPNLALATSEGNKIVSADAGKSSTPSYRPDVDGLRAVAILAVILFHANSKLIPGGFIGVDIFFVISGFLITGLLAKSIDRGTFSFKDFYTRRIKRIFPAYIAVAAVTFLISTYLLIPNDYIFYTTSLAASWGFASNIFFSMLSWGYFGQRTEEFPLLHTWSLSVEEQFYFLFPFLLIFLYRHGRKHIISLLVILGIACVAYSEWKTGETRSYFLLTSRAHELIIGALTFFISQKLRQIGKGLSLALAVLGSSLMVGSLFTIDGRHFPGILSAIPCVGTALIIIAGQTRNPISSLLKTRLMVGIGLLSYSLYLWHWPIFSFLRYRRIELTFPVAAAAVTLAFALAIFSWKFIEHPIRHNKKLDFGRAFTLLYVVPAGIFMGIGAYSYFTEGAPARFSGEMRELISSYSFERDLSRACSIRADDYRTVDAAYLSERCAFGDLSQQEPQVLLIGDSHANHFKPFVEQLSKHARLKAVFHVQGDCAPVHLTDASQSEEATTCQKRNEDLLALAKHYRYVVLAGFWYERSFVGLEGKLKRATEIIKQAGAVPIVFKDNAYFEPDLSQCILYKKRGWLPESKNCNIPYEFVAQTQGQVDLIIDRVKETDPQLIVIDPKKVMCNSSECLTYEGNTAYYKDANHINATAAKFLAEKYIRQESNPLAAIPFSQMHAAITY